MEGEDGAGAVSLVCLDMISDFSSVGDGVDGIATLTKSSEGDSEEVLDSIGAGVFSPIPI